MRNRAMTIRPVAILTALVLAVPAFAGVTVDFDKEADFTKLRTFAWMEGTPAKNELNQKRIVAAIEKELGLKGLKPAEGVPHLYVVTHVSTDQQVVMDSTSTGMYGHSYWGGGWGTTSVNVRTIPVGTLVVDLLDGATKNLLWRGVASDTMNPAPDKVEKKINQVVAKMFSKFPPQQKKK